MKADSSRVVMRRSIMQSDRMGGDAGLHVSLLSRAKNVLSGVALRKTLTSQNTYTYIADDLRMKTDVRVR